MKAVIVPVEGRRKAEQGGGEIRDPGDKLLSFLCPASCPSFCLPLSAPPTLLRSTSETRSPVWETLLLTLGDAYQALSPKLSLHTGVVWFDKDLRIKLVHVLPRR